MRQLSIPQASADTKGGLLHCPDSPPPQHGNAGHGKTGVCKGRVRGCTLRCFSLARSERCVLGTKGTHTTPTVSSIQSHHSLSSRKPPWTPDQAGCSRAEERL